MISIFEKLNIKVVIRDTVPETERPVVFLQVYKDLMRMKGHCVLNTEQVTRPVVKTFLSHCKNLDVKIIDYSLGNIEAMKYLNMNISYLPYQYNETEVNLLSNLIKTSKKLYDVVFVESLSERRAKIISGFWERKISCLILTHAWNLERDKQIAKCRVLLNLHFDPSYGVYESIRCDRWLFAGLPVVSEIGGRIDGAVSMQNLTIAETEPIENLAICCPYDDLINNVAKVLKGYEEHVNMLIEKRNSVIGKVRIDREEKVREAAKFIFAGKE